MAREGWAVVRAGRGLLAFLSTMVRYHPRLLLSFGLAAGLFVILPQVALRVRFLVAFDVGAAVWLVLAIRSVLSCSAAEVHLRAQGDDEGAWVALLVSVLATATSLAAVILEAGSPADGDLHRWEHVALAVGTLILSWLFLHSIFAFHYAREYYDAARADAAPMLGFPGGAEPDYWDFLYFAFNLGTASQTADVTVNSPRLRRFVLGHQIASYLFNATVIALGVNVAAALM